MGVEGTAFNETLAEIDGQKVTVRDLSHAISTIIQRLDRPQSFSVCTLNLDHLVKLRQNPNFRAAYARAEIVLADGFPIVILARLDNVELERATGADMIEPLCRAAADRNYPIFLFGTTFSALCAAARQLVATIPNLTIAGVYSPPQGFDTNSPVADEVISIIRQSGARICFVALGAPRQEVFAARALDATSGVAFLGIGASLDFIAGTQTRCPELVQRLNLEWAWRALSNPRRLGWRYYLCAWLFAKLYTRGLAARLFQSPQRRGVY
jgi:N-acetylglucosaminyldiphosphoundecaprenol N-acetyl-beta-D-mannosaminyltransferase